MPAKVVVRVEDVPRILGYLKSRPQPERQTPDELSLRQFFERHDVRARLRLLRSQGHQVRMIAELLKEAGAPGSVFSLRDGVTMALKPGGKKSPALSGRRGRKSRRKVDGSKSSGSAGKNTLAQATEEPPMIDTDLSVKPPSKVMREPGKQSSAKSQLSEIVSDSAPQSGSQIVPNVLTVSDARPRNGPGTLYEVPENLLKMNDRL